MKTSLLVVVLLVPALAMSDEPKAANSRADSERQKPVMRTVALAEVLDLEPDQALRLSAAMAAFDDRHPVAMEQLQQADEALRSAIEGSGATLTQVDAAIQQHSDAQTQMQQIDREMYAAHGRG